MVGLCRLCASLKKPDLLTNITDQSHEICQKLRNCCSLNIQMSDALPKSVCVECLEQLNLSHKFYTKVHAAQETLEDLFPYMQLHKGETTYKKDAKQPNQKSMTAEEVIQKSLQHLTNKQTSNIKIGKEQQCSDNRASFTVASIVSETDDVDATDNDGYLQEVYDILEMAQEDDSRKEHEPMNIIINALDKEEHSTTEDDHHYLEVEEQMEDDEVAGEDEHESVTDDADAAMQIGEVVIENGLSEEQIMLSDEFEVEVDDVIATNEESSSTNEYSHPDMIDSETEQKGYSCLHFQTQVYSWKSFNYLCYACPYKTSSYKDLIQHSDQVHSVNDLNKLQFKCHDCHKVFSRYSTFLNHVRYNHHPALKLRCDACDMLCSDYKHYKIHRDISCIEAKSLPVAITCSLCSKSFHCASGLHVHSKQHTVSNSPQDDCKFCLKESKQKATLRYHEKSHTNANEPEYACEYCDKLFATNKSLESHLNSHCEERLSKCDICHRNFKKENMERHRMTHTSARPFKCNYCERHFRTKIEQTTHERIHTGEMPLQCPHCAKRFRFRSALNAHLKVHSGVRDYSCKYCIKTFRDISNFKKHVRRKHADEERAANKGV